MTMIQIFSMLCSGCSELKQIERGNIYEKNIVTFVCLLLTSAMLVPTFTFTVSAQASQSCVACIEQELRTAQTSVISELDKMIVAYARIYNQSPDAAVQEKSQEIIDTLVELQDTYLAEKSSVCSYALHPIYAIEVASVIAYFNLKGYNLSAELLTHMKSNTSLDSEYIPLYGGNVCESSVFQTIVDSQKTGGKGVFPNTGNKNDKDLYYAIHAFDFTRLGMLTIVISDRYDFASDKEYTSIAGVAISKMYQAQQDGYLTPFLVKIYAS